MEVEDSQVCPCQPSGVNPVLTPDPRGSAQRESRCICHRLLLWPIEFDSTEEFQHRNLWKKTKTMHYMCWCFSFGHKVDFWTTRVDEVRNKQSDPESIPQIR